MNKHIKNFLIRGMLFAGFGPIILGIIYMFSLYIISSIITGNFAVTSYSIIMIAVSIISGIIGGIIGVNRK